MNRRIHYRYGYTTPRAYSPEKAITVFLAVGLALESGRTGPAAFAVEITAAAQVLADTTDGMFNEIDSQTVPNPVGAVSANKQAGVGVLGGVAHADAGLGWIKLNAFSDSIVSTVYASGYLDAIAVGEFVDEITVTPANPALLNQAGTATFAYHVGGFAARGEGGSAVQAGVNSLNPGLGTLLANNFYGNPFNATFDITHEYTQNLIFGQPFELHVMMFARARVEVNGAFDIATFAEVDLGNTFEWMGALEVADQSDQEVTDYTMTSASGTDYRNAITAPADSETIPGDYNDDGTVDAADYVVWRRNEGTMNVLPNDPIGETIGAAQYDQWRAHFGATGGAGAAAGANVAVPEPFTLILLLSLPIMVRHRRRDDLMNSRVFWNRGHRAIHFFKL